MKPFIYRIALIVGTLFAVAATAIAQSVSHCTIYNEENLKFTVFLNGEQKNDEPTSRVRMINLTQPYYKLRIVFEDNSLKNIERGIFQLTNAAGSPVDATHVIKLNKKGEPKLSWQSQTDFPAYIETNKPTVVVVQQGGTVQQTTTTTTNNGASNGGVSLDIGLPIGIGGVRINTAEPSTKQTTTTTTVAAAPATNGAVPCAGGAIFGEDDFKAALKSIKARSSDDGKLLSAKQFVSANCMNVSQVKTIMQAFGGEDKKLDFAKYAYEHTIDKGNYFRLNDEFKDEKNIDELAKAITK